MRLTACECRAEHYHRVGRAMWMKAIWTRRLYHCYACDAFLLLPPESVDRRLDGRNGFGFAPTEVLAHESAGRRTHRQEKPA